MGPNSAIAASQALETWLHISFQFFGVFVASKGSYFRTYSTVARKQ